MPKAAKKQPSRSVKLPVAVWDAFNEIRDAADRRVIEHRQRSFSSGETTLLGRIVADWHRRWKNGEVKLEELYFRPETNGRE